MLVNVLLPPGEKWRKKQSENAAHESEAYIKMPATHARHGRSFLPCYGRELETCGEVCHIQSSVKWACPASGRLRHCCSSDPMLRHVYNLSLKRPSSSTSPQVWHGRQCSSHPYTGVLQQAFLPCFLLQACFHVSFWDRTKCSMHLCSI